MIIIYKINFSKQKKFNIKKKTKFPKKIFKKPKKKKFFKNPIKIKSKIQFKANNQKYF